MEIAKDIFTVVGGMIGLLVFGKGVLEFIHLNTIRRYEKFHEMSVRFDESKEIQKVCALLQRAKPKEPVTTQEKEIFICFLEEIYFMVNSGIMKKDLALYTFGHYAQMAADDNDFWNDLKRDHPFYTQFRAFCDLATSYRPGTATIEKNVVY